MPLSKCLLCFFVCDIYWYMPRLPFLISKLGRKYLAHTKNTHTWTMKRGGPRENEWREIDTSPGANG